mmetsp:Transcript_55884/g.154765  ORF Transcript_55884/g.154765 Transcript_55884/m.154765 type:complete len:330 (-) Transcript_55884:14-1003(-)
MIDLLPLRALVRHARVNASTVIHDVCLGLEGGNQRPAADQLPHHLLFGGGAIVATHIMVVICAPPPRQALDPAMQLALSVAGVWPAALRHKADVLGPACQEEGIATIAALVVLGAVEREANGETLRVRVALSDPVPRREHARGRHRVARTAFALVQHGVQVAHARNIPPIPSRWQGHLRPPPHALARAAAAAAGAAPPCLPGGIEALEEGEACEPLVLGAGARRPLLREGEGAANARQAVHLAEAFADPARMPRSSPHVLQQVQAFSERGVVLLIEGLIVLQRVCQGGGHVGKQACMLLGQQRAPLREVAAPLGPGLVTIPTQLGFTAP